MSYGYEHDSVKYEVLYDGRIVLLTLNRPDRMNAYTSHMGAALTHAYERAGADPLVRVVVLTGAGRGFCAGADMGVLQSIDGKAGGQSETQAPVMQKDWILTPTRIPKPVICAINGSCAGIGLSLALACDFRFAAAGAKFTSAFPKRGLIAEHGVSWALPQLMGTGNAMMFMLSGDIFTSEDVHQMGMVQRVMAKESVLEEVLAYACRVADNTPPASAAVIKQQIWHHPHMTREAALAESNLLMAATVNKRNPDFKEGVESFVQKRSPAFGHYDSSREVIGAAKLMFEPKGAKL